MYAAIDAGVPQLFLPEDGATDCAINAAAATARGIGLTCAPEDVTADVVRDVIGDDRFRVAAGEVRAEAVAMPPPAQLLARVEASAR
jgi:UDP:flavonoid glycosyltransferase YjiC (YdhE family)